MTIRYKVMLDGVDRHVSVVVRYDDSNGQHYAFLTESGLAMRVGRHWGHTVEEAAAKLIAEIKNLDPLAVVNRERVVEE